MFKLLPAPTIVKAQEEATECLAKLSGVRLVSFDTETTGVSRTKDRAVILALSDGKSRWAIWDSAIPYFKDLLENPEVKLIAHNANFDAWMTLNVGIDLDKFANRTHYRLYDTMVMHALLRDCDPHDLKTLTKKYLGIDMVPFKKVFGSQMRKRSLHEILLDPANTDVVGNYASLDAYATYQLFIIFREMLHKETIDPPIMGMSNLLDYYYKTELPFTKVLWSMERTGILADQDYLLNQAPRLEAQMLGILKWFIRDTGDMTINLNSNPEMRNLFFGILGHTPLSHTEKGAPQLNKAALEKWAKNGCTRAKNLLEYRSLGKQLGTYITNLLDKINPINSRVHTTFKQTGARTGRLSSSEPNMQNQPAYIRSAFISGKHHRLLAYDYAQLEMRILAHFSKDKTLCTAIKEGYDVHSTTAAKMFKVPYEDIIEARRIDDEGGELTFCQKELLSYRKAAKAINFGLMYGQGSNKLAATLECTRDEAVDLIRQYFRTFPKVTGYFKKAIAKATGLGYTTTILGRRRQVDQLKSTIPSDVAQGERLVKNTPIQGTAADATKMAMIKIYEDPVITISGIKMLLQVHDEIVFQVPRELEKNEHVNTRIQQIMSDPFGFDLEVPLETSSKYGDNWMECK
jgi:DNA polymerase-1